MLRVVTLLLFFLAKCDFLLHLLLQITWLLVDNLMAWDNELGILVWIADCLEATGTVHGRALHRGSHA